MPAPLPTSKQFRQDTAHTNPLKWGKMRNSIARIDTALDTWHNQRTLDNTILVYKECRHFLKAKQGKTSANSLKRQSSVRKLCGECIQWFGHFDPDLMKALGRFEGKKSQGAKPGLKSMGGAYKHERSLYVQSGKTYAPSATSLKPQKGQLPALANKSFDALTELEYDQLDQHLKRKNPVVYLKKLDRLKDMIFVEVHLGSGALKLVDYKGNPYSTHTDGWGNELNHGNPYAIDRYGNLFSVDEVAHKGQFNHSSFNAGNDVVCAGMIHVVNGVLHKIDNNSGHYAPTQAQLHNAAQMIFAELKGASPNAIARLFDFTNAGAHGGQAEIYDFPLGQMPSAGHVGHIKKW